MPQMPLTTFCKDHWTWNNNDKSDEVKLHGSKDRVAHFHPNWSNGTAGVRGTRVLNGGRYYWEINVKNIFGTSIMFGIGTKKARLHVEDDFVNMLGEDKHSWGLSHKGRIWHAGRYKSYTEPFRNIPTLIGVYFDGLAGTLTYYKDGVSLGIAFIDLQNVTEQLYPIVCSTAAKTEMSLGLLKQDFQNLQDRCRASILSQLTCEEEIERYFQNVRDQYRRRNGSRASILSQLTCKRILSQLICEEKIEQLELPTIVKHFISEGLDYSQEDYFDEGEDIASKPIFT